MLQSSSTNVNITLIKHCLKENIVRYFLWFGVLNSSSTNVNITLIKQRILWNMAKCLVEQQPEKSPKIYEKKIVYVIFYGLSSV